MQRLESTLMCPTCTYNELKISHKAPRAKLTVVVEVRFGGGVAPRHLGINYTPGFMELYANQCVVCPLITS